MSEELKCDSADLPFVYVDRNEEILDPNLPNVTKIGTMARLCYRTEPKDAESQHDVDLRVIKHCIKSGHESVLEHGIMSVFINPNAGEDSARYGKKYLKGEGPLNFHQVFSMGATDAQMKYLESFMDPELYDKFVLRNHLNDSEKRILPCFVGNVRAWRQVIRERIFIETQSANKLALAITLKVLFELDKSDDDHILFGDLVENVNSGMLKDPEFIKTYWDTDLMGELPAGEIDLATFCKAAFTNLNTVVAGQSSSCASISIIITTDRATTHQHVRHRKNVGYSQESQRYVNYDKKGLRIIPLTMEPSKFLPWCKDHDKNISEIFANYDLGRVRPDSYGSYYFVPWQKGAVNAARAYMRLVDLDKTWGDDFTKTGLPKMPPETARDKLENDTATRLGVTWMRTSSFINFIFWRLEAHAQYTIRSAYARILKEMFLKGHPFAETIPHNLAMSWLNQIKEEKLFQDDSIIDKIISYREQVNANVQRYIKEHTSELEAQRK